jgi:hypothetical protein
VDAPSLEGLVGARPIAVVDRRRQRLQWLKQRHGKIRQMDQRAIGELGRQQPGRRLRRRQRDARRQSAVVQRPRQRRRNRRRLADEPPEPRHIEQHFAITDPHDAW